MNDCRPNWYKKYGDSLQHWTDGKVDFRVLWKDNEGTERRYATFATDSHDAILRCAMAHPIVVDRIVDVHVFSARDIMTLEQYTAKVDKFMETDHGYKPGVTKHFPLTVMQEYNAGSTPEDAADRIQYDIEDADEGT